MVEKANGDNVIVTTAVFLALSLLTQEGITRQGQEYLPFVSNLPMNIDIQAKFIAGKDINVTKSQNYITHYPD